MSDVSVPPAVASRSATQWLMALQRRAPVAQLVALIALFVYGASTIAGFGAWMNVKSMLTLAALLGLASFGQTLVVILGGLDLSVGGFIVMGAILVSQLSGAHGWASPLAIAFIVIVAAVMGGASGWICHRYRIQPLIVTLGMGGLAAGATVAWTKAQITGTAPTFLTDIVSPINRTFGVDVPPIVAIWAVVAVVAAIAMHRTVGGRRLYFTGANPLAADLSLIRTGRVWVVVFALSAVVAALVGVLLAGFSGADQALGDPYLFQGLTAVIVGGTTIMGARGDYTQR